jgi:HEPN domain-containing protein
MLTRALLQDLAETRRRDAEILLAHGRYSGAYYLSGYAVECAIKARIASRFLQDVIPARNLVNDTYSHRLGELIGVAGLKSDLEKHMANDQDFATRWGFISKWSEASRYETWDPVIATTLYESVAEPAKGVLQWIKSFW